MDVYFTLHVPQANSLKPQSCCWKCYFAFPIPGNTVSIYLQLCNSATSCVNERAQVFYRIEVNGQLFYSAQYGRIHKGNSYTIMYTDVTGQENLALFSVLLHLLTWSLRWSQNSGPTWCNVPGTLSTYLLCT